MIALQHRPLADSADSLLRFALRADATLCAGAGLIVAVAADPLAHLTGLSPTGEWLGGAAMVAYGGLLYLLAAVGDLRRIGRVVVAANAVFAVLPLLSLGWLPLTVAGVALSVALSAGTVAMTALQYLGVRRLSA
jgi:hypothetical protein